MPCQDLDPTEGDRVAQRHQLTHARVGVVALRGLFYGYVEHLVYLLYPLLPRTRGDIDSNIHGGTLALRHTIYKLECLNARKTAKRFRDSSMVEQRPVEGSVSEESENENEVNCWKP